MKIFFLIRTVLFLALAGLCGCAKSPGDTFKFDVDALYGSWESTEMKVEGQWIDLTQPENLKLVFYPKFSPDKVYTCSGSFGKVNLGRYRTEGDQITSFDSYGEHIHYSILSMSAAAAEMIVRKDKDELRFRFKKQDEDEYGGVAVSGVWLSDSNLNLSSGEQATLTATVIPLNASTNYVSWSSDKKDLVSVDGGVVTAKMGSGSAVITADVQDGAFRAICNVKVDGKLIVSVPELRLENGTMQTLTCRYVNSEPCNAASWSSDRPQIVRVERIVEKGDAYAALYGLSEGNAEVTASLPDGSLGVCRVEVAPTGGLSVDYKADRSGNMWGTVSCQTLSGLAYLFPVWESSDTSVLTIARSEDQANSAIVYAHKPGAATISVKSKDGKLSAGYNLTIEKPAIESCVELKNFTTYTFGNNTLTVDIEYLINNKAPNFYGCDITPSMCAVVTTEDNDGGYRVVSLPIFDPSWKIAPGDRVNGKFRTIVKVSSGNLVDLMNHMKRYYRVLLMYNDSQGQVHQTVQNLN